MYLQILINFFQLISQRFGCFSGSTIYSPEFFYNKLSYIHNNPVNEMIVEKEEDYLFSSARNYADHESLLEIIKETPRLITY